jgi:chromosome segregation ATPase
MQNSAGATSKAYTTMTDTTVDAQEDMANAALNLKMVIGEQLNPVLKDIYSVGTTAFSWVGGFLEEHPAVTAALAGISIAVGAVAIAMTAFALVTSPIVVTAIHSITAAMTANPIFLIITGVVALTAAVVAFVSILARQESEYDSWTNSTREQYDELQNLNAEYEEAAEKYGETSDEALALRHETDALTAEFEASKQTLEEFVAECDTLIESHDRLMQSYTETTSKIGDEEQGTLALIYKLEELGEKTNKTASEQEQMKAIIDQLNRTVPGLALNYDDVTASLNGTAEALRKMAHEQAEQERKAEMQRAYVDALKEQALLTDQIAEAETNLNIEREKFESQVSSGWYSGFPSASLAADVGEYEKALDGLLTAQSENYALIEELEQKYKDIATAEEDARNAVTDYDGAVKTALDSIQGEMDELVQKYDEAYAAARQSIDSQIGLFDTMKTETELSVADMTAAMQSQVDYLSTYTENLRKAADLGLDEGLIASLSDGSAESAGQLDAIISKVEKLGGTTQEAQDFIDDFNKKFDEVEAAKDSFATTVAEMETDFTAKMDEMQEKLLESVDSMNMETEAAEAAKDTLTAYIDGIKAQQENAVSAAKAVADATAKALGTTAAVSITVSGDANGYATGTTSAAPGLALVGEEGPELVNFGGGEIVYTAPETERIIASLGDRKFDTPLPAYLSGGGTETPGNPTENSRTEEKRIVIDITGSGEIGVEKGADEETVVNLLFKHIKPVLTSIVRQDIFEEGDLAYDY